ncbi:MAG: dethiobiotin synthase [Myxococcales bacterium]|nr:dethiobiotin synthase [Myxococcales bacterium]
MSSRPSPPPLRMFVTATDTGVGKTEAACALLSLLADRGLRPAPFKPYESGCADPRRPPDALALRKAAQSDDELALVCPHRFRLPLAPGVAAAREGQEPSFRQTLAAWRSFRGRPVVAEGAGGLLVPIDSKHEVVDLIRALRLPVLLVARAGLGTLNHTSLSLEALRKRRIETRAVLLVRGARGSDESERENSALIRERHRVEVLGPVPFLRRASERRAAFRRALSPLL